MMIGRRNMVLLAIVLMTMAVVVVVRRARSGKNLVDDARSSTNAAGPIAMTMGSTYWNEERRRNAAPVYPMCKDTES